MADDSPTGTRPVQFIFLSSDAQPLTIQPGNRRFWLVDEARTSPIVILPPGLDGPEAVPEHPSRTAPRCKNCRHMVRDMVRMYCDHPSMPVDPASGLVETPVDRARSRSSDRGGCGVSGALFEPLADSVSNL